MDKHTMSLTFRLEQPRDFRAVEQLTRDAFWGHTSPKCDEHFLVHRLRDDAAFVPELDFVAEAEGKIVGHVIYSRAKIVADTGNTLSGAHAGKKRARNSCA